MAELKVKGQSYNYPDPGTEPGWGEDATEWASAVSDALGELVGGEDKLRGETVLSAAITPTNTLNLKFTSTLTRQAKVVYTIVRGSLQESGELTIEQRTGSWNILRESFGDDVGAIFTITGTGQVQHTLTAGVDASMSFRITTLGVE